MKSITDKDIKTIGAIKNENVASRPADLVKIVAWEDVDGIESNWAAENAII